MSSSWGLSEFDDIRDVQGDFGDQDLDREIQRGDGHHDKSNRSERHSSRASHSGRNYRHDRSSRSNRNPSLFKESITIGETVAKSLSGRKWDTEKTMIILSAIVSIIIGLALSIIGSTIPGGEGLILVGGLVTAIGVGLGICAFIKGGSRENQTNVPSSRTAVSQPTSPVVPVVQARPVDANLTPDENAIVGYIRTRAATVRDLSVLQALSGKRKSEIGRICDGLVRKNLLKKAGQERRETYSLVVQTAAVATTPVSIEAGSEPFVPHTHNAYENLILRELATKTAVDVESVKQLFPAGMKRGTIGNVLEVLASKGFLTRVELAGKVAGKEAYQRVASWPNPTFFPTDEELVKLLSPQNDVERQIMNDAEWKLGARWGRKRRGHDEGLVALHVADVLKNVEAYAKEHRISTEDLVKLRQIAFIHDTFKYNQKVLNKHHSIVAYEFAKKIGITDNETLMIIKMHDEAWQTWKRDPSTGGALIEKLSRLGIRPELYYAFFHCDTALPGKDQAPLAWFIGLIKDTDQPGWR